MPCATCGRSWVECECGDVCRLDGATAKHLAAWLDRSVPGHLRDQTLDLIFKALDEYPDLVEKGRSWTEIRTVGERIVERKMA